MCAAVGGFIGGVAGAIIGNNNSSDDPVAGAAIGLGSGAAVGAALCAAFARPKLEPVASVSGSPLSGRAPLTVNLRADASDPDGQIVSYAWDLGDGNRATGDSLSHTYTNPGVYTAELLITDDDGLTATNSVRINVTAPVSTPPPLTTRGVPITLGDSLLRLRLGGAPRGSGRTTEHTRSRAPGRFRSAGPRVRLH